MEVILHGFVHTEIQWLETVGAIARISDTD